MALDNLSFFNAMNREEVKPPFPHPHRPLTSQEAHFAIMEKVNACIQEVNHFEQRVRVKIDDFMDRANVENTAFKEAIQASYNAFMETVQREVNNFEVDIQNNFDIYRNDVDKRIVDFQTAINNEFETLQSNVIKVTNEKIAELEALKIELNKGYTDYKNAMLDIVNNFKTTVTAHMESQDNKIEEYKNYMVDNILESTEKVFDKKAQNGEISALMTAIYGDSRVFKGSLSYDEIQAITDASNGDYYYCTTDEHYYQRTENTWVDIGTGEMIADSFVKFIEAFNNGTAFKSETIEPKILKGFTNIINNNVTIANLNTALLLNNNVVSGVVDEGEYLGLRYYGLEANKTYALLINIEGTEKAWNIGVVWNGSTWNKTGTLSTDNKKVLIFNTGDTVNELGTSLLGFTTSNLLGETIEATFYLFDVSNMKKLFESEIPYTFDDVLNNTFLYSHFCSISEKALTADSAKNAKNASYALLPSIEITSEMVKPFASTFDSVNGGEVTFTATATYGGFMVELPKMYKDIIFICETDATEKNVHFGFLNTSARWDKNKTVATKVINEKTVAYVKLSATENARATVGCTLGGSPDITIPHNFKLHLIDASYIDEVTDIIVSETISENHQLILNHIAKAQANPVIAPLKGKKVLCIGDSITATRQWQNVLAERGAEITTHALGGGSIVAPFIGSTNSNGSIEALKISDVCDKDYIIILLGYNNRNYDNGKVGDLWEEGETMTTAGCMQFIINRLYELLGGGIENEIEYNSNLTCKVLIVTPHCAGKYPYNNVDGYGEYPVGSGQTMETLSNIIRDVALYNNIPVCDLWHNSGINKFTWTIYGANPIAYVENPSNTDTPYPHNGDQLHCSSAGYQRIGETIYSALQSYYNI